MALIIRLKFFKIITYFLCSILIFYIFAWFYDENLLFLSSSKKSAKIEFCQFANATVHSDKVDFYTAKSMYYDKSIKYVKCFYHDDNKRIIDARTPSEIPWFTNSWTGHFDFSRTTKVATLQTDEGQKVECNLDLIK